MVQTDREVRRARLDELRQVREELVRAGGFKVDPSKDSGDALAEAWIEPREGPGLAGGGAAAGRLRERLGAARRGGDAAGSGGPAGRAEGAGGQLIRRLLEKRMGGSAPGAGGARDQGNGDSDARRERLKRLMGLLDRGGRGR